MNSDYYQQIAQSTAHRKSRDDNKDFVFAKPEYLRDLTQIAFNTQDKNHHKACWILELICEERMELFVPYLDEFCDALKNQHSDSAIRSISKIALFLTKSKKIKLNEAQEEQLIESGLDWLIQTEKAANAAYTMRFLFNLGKKYSWVNDELKIVLSRDFGEQTPGYRSAVKDILKRLK